MPPRPLNFVRCLVNLFLNTPRNCDFTPSLARLFQAVRSWPCYAFVVYVLKIPGCGRSQQYFLCLWGMTIFNERRSQLCTWILKHHWILLSNTAEVINTVFFVPLCCPYSFHRILSLWGDSNSSWTLQDLLPDQGGVYSSELTVTVLTYKCFLLPFSAMGMEIFLIC